MRLRRPCRPRASAPRSAPDLARRPSTASPAGSAHALADELARGRLVERPRGFAGEPGFFRQSFGPGWALVGDAALFKDPITAHGITDALRDAALLAQAVELPAARDAFAAYQATRDALSLPLFARHRRDRRLARRHGRP